jgi:hypothetical protein
MFRRFGAPILAGAVALAGGLFLARAADGPKVLTPEKAPDPAPVTPVDLKDAAFDAYIDPDALAKAWAGLEPGALADVALKLVAGEKAVGRAHQKLPADKLFEVALRVAADKKDIQTLERIAAETEKMKRADLHEKTEFVLKLARTSRAVDPALTPGDKHSPETNIQLHLYQSAIEIARLNRDAQALKDLEKSLAENPHLKGTTAAAMKKLLHETLDNLPKEEDESIALLRKLSGQSRGGATKPGDLAVDTSGAGGTYTPGPGEGFSLIPFPVSPSLGTPLKPAVAGNVGLSLIGSNPKPAPPPPPKEVKVAFTIINRVTQYSVAFDLVPAPGKPFTIMLNPDGKAHPFSVGYVPGVGTPAIKIWQVGGKAPLSFSVANGGKYQFLMDPKDGNKIKNYLAQ